MVSLYFSEDKAGATEIVRNKVHRGQRIELKMIHANGLKSLDLPSSAFFKFFKFTNKSCDCFSLEEFFH